LVPGRVEEVTPVAREAPSSVASIMSLAPSSLREVREEFTLLRVEGRDLVERVSWRRRSCRDCSERQREMALRERERERDRQRGGEREEVRERAVERREDSNHFCVELKLSNW
jgi:hypothetical protein